MTNTDQTINALLDIATSAALIVGGLPPVASGYQLGRIYASARQLPEDLDGVSDILEGVVLLLNIPDAEGRVVDWAELACQTTFEIAQQAGCFDAFVRRTGHLAGELAQLGTAMTEAESAPLQ